MHEMAEIKQPSNTSEENNDNKNSVGANCEVQKLVNRIACFCECDQIRGQELCESRGGRPGLPVPKSPYGLCRRKATLNIKLLHCQNSGAV